MKQTYPLVSGAFCLISYLFLTTSCGDGKNQQQKSVPPPTADYGELSFEGAPTVKEGVSQELTVVEACHVNEVGLLTMVFSQGPNTPALQMQIKDFATDRSTYNCRQAEDNKDKGSVGLAKFNGCGVDVWTPSETKGSLNKYSLYRDTKDMFGFAYSGECTINLEYEAPRVKGTIRCMNLIQTVLEGLNRVPIDPEDTISLVKPSHFHCDIR